MRYGGRLLVLFQVDFTSCHILVPQKLFRISMWRKYIIICLCESLLFKGSFQKKKIVQMNNHPEFSCWKIFIFFSGDLPALLFGVSSLSSGISRIFCTWKRPQKSSCPYFTDNGRESQEIRWHQQAKLWENFYWNLCFLCLRPEFNFTTIPWSVLFLLNLLKPCSVSWTHARWQVVANSECVKSQWDLTCEVHHSQWHDLCKTASWNIVDFQCILQNPELFKLSPVLP